MNSPAAEVARTDLSEVTLDGPLKNMAQAWAIAKVLAQSSMVPQALRGSPQNCLVTMMLGQELKLTWTQATRGIYVLPNGTPGLRGQLLLALIRNAGHRYTFERTDDSCTCVITRKDEDHKIPYEGTFTLADAKAAGLVSEKDGKLFARSSRGEAMPWEQYRRDMLQWRAVARAAGIGAPEVIYGFDIAGIGDGTEGAVPAVAPGPAPASPVASPDRPGQVYDAEIVDNDRARLAELDASMTPAAEDDTTAGRQRAVADYDARPEGPCPIAQGEGERKQADPRAAGAASPRGAQPPPPPGYDDLDQLLQRSGFHGDTQADLVSALVHRHVNSVTDLSKGEVLIAHDVITKAIRGATTSGARRAALTQLAAAERDAMNEATAEAEKWHG